MRQPTIHLPTSCQESWDAMTPTSAGRHCTACQQVVVDFTSLTDAEILATLRRHPGTSCGRFQTSQLGRPLLAAPPPAGWQRWLGATLALLGVGATVGLKAQAQTTLPVSSGGPAPAGVVRAERPASPVTNGPASPATERPAAGPLLPLAQPVAQVLRGTVRDSATQQGLPGATVLLAGTVLGVSTNVDGDFQLEIPPHEAAAVTGVVFSYIGYTSVRQALPTPTDSKPIVVTLAADYRNVSTGVIVTGWPPWYTPMMLRYRVKRLFHRH